MGIGMRNSALGIQNTANDWNPESEFHLIRNQVPEYGIHSLRASSPGRFGGRGPKMDGELATRNLEFEYLFRKSRCKMLIGGDDISNDVITLGTCFSMLFSFALVSASR